jgi:hypothetical protein
MKILKDVKSSPFLKLERKYYFGKIKYGTPYFNPSGFNPTFISFRKLIPRSKEEYEKIIEGETLASRKREI